jgi:hypothetical protein
VTTLWEAARGIYSVALVASLVLLAWSMRPAFRVLRALAEAISHASRALEKQAQTAEAQAEQAKKIDEIHAAVCRPPKPPT